MGEPSGTMMVAPEATEQGLLGDSTDREQRLADLRSEVADMIVRQPIEKPKHVQQFFRDVTFKTVGTAILCRLRFHIIRNNTLSEAVYYVFYVFLFIMYLLCIMYCHTLGYTLARRHRARLPTRRVCIHRSTGHAPSRRLRASGQRMNLHLLRGHGRYRSLF